MFTPTEEEKVMRKIITELSKGASEGVLWRDVIGKDALGLNEEQWSQVISRMLDDNLVDGFAEVKKPGVAYSTYKIMSPRVTRDGLRFMEETSAVKKAMSGIKEIKDTFK